MLPNIHILGIQGSGKGTQSALLVDKYGFGYISSGDLFRQRAEKGDTFGQELKAQLHSGHLLPDSYLFQTVNDYLADADISSGLLGDGVIRTVDQYQGLEPIWDMYRLGEPLLIHLVLSEDVALQRIAHRQTEQQDPSKQQYHIKYSGKLLKRTDDNPAAIQERFKIFHQMTEPVIWVFDHEHRCVHIPADRSVEEINKDICLALEHYYPQLSHVTDQE